MQTAHNPPPKPAVPVRGIDSAEKFAFATAKAANDGETIEFVDEIPLEQVDDSSKRTLRMETAGSRETPVSTTGTDVSPTTRAGVKEMTEAACKSVGETQNKTKPQ